jgi:hypothetical protein
MAARLKPIISVSLSLVLFLTQVVLASSAETNFWTERQRANNLQLASLHPAPAATSLPAWSTQLPPVMPIKASSGALQTKKSASKPLQNLLTAIPQIYGTIQEVFDAGSQAGAPVVLIQDIHLNTEAQNNIAAILQELIDQKQIGLVGVEGAFGLFDFQPFRKYLNKPHCQAVIEDALMKNLLGAPSYVGMTSAAELPVFTGIDDAAHYEANIEALHLAQDQKSTLKQRVQQHQEILREAKAAHYSPALADFDRGQTAYRRGNMGFGDYVTLLASYDADIDLSIQQFSAAYDMEKRLDFSRVESERRSAIEKLTKVLTESEVSLLVTQSLAYRMGRLGFGAYYQWLRDLCETKGIRLSQTPHFDNYIRYVLLSDGIKADRLFESVDKLEKSIVSRLAQTQEEKATANASEALVLIDKLLEFSLTPREWGNYKSIVNSRLSIDQGSEINKDSLIHKLLTIDHRPNLSSFERFYEEADVRSEKMVENLKKMAQGPIKDIPPHAVQWGGREGPLLASPSLRDREEFLSSSPGHDHAAVLVVGGFHTSHITELLKKQNTPYIVVSPKITKIDNDAGSAYLSVFSREKTPLDRLFAGEKLFVYPDHLAVGTRHPRTDLMNLLLAAALSVLPVEPHQPAGPPQMVSHQGASYSVQFSPNKAADAGLGLGPTVVIPASSKFRFNQVFTSAPNAILYYLTGSKMAGLAGVLLLEAPAILALVFMAHPIIGALFILIFKAVEVWIGLKRNPQANSGLPVLAGSFLKNYLVGIGLFSPYLITPLLLDPLIAGIVAVSFHFLSDVTMMNRAPGQADVGQDINKVIQGLRMERINPSYVSILQGILGNPIHADKFVRALNAESDENLVKRIIFLGFHLNLTQDGWPQFMNAIERQSPEISARLLEAFATDAFISHISDASIEYPSISIPLHSVFSEITTAINEALNNLKAAGQRPPQLSLLAWLMNQEVQYLGITGTYRDHYESRMNFYNAIQKHQNGHPWKTLSKLNLRDIKKIFGSALVGGMSVSLLMQSMRSEFFRDEPPQFFGTGGDIQLILEPLVRQRFLLAKQSGKKQIIKVGVVGAAAGQQPISVVVEIDRLFTRLGIADQDRNAIDFEVHVFDRPHVIYKALKENKLLYPKQSLKLFSKVADKLTPEERVEQQRYFDEKEGGVTRSRFVSEHLHFHDINLLKPDTLNVPDGAKELDLLAVHNVIQYLTPPQAGHKAENDDFRFIIDAAVSFTESLLAVGGVPHIYSSGNVHPYVDQAFSGISDRRGLKYKFPFATNQARKEYFATQAKLLSPEASPANDAHNALGERAPANSFISYFTNNPKAILAGMVVEIATLVTSYIWFSQLASFGVITAIVFLHIISLAHALASGRAPPVFLRSAPIVHGLQFGFYALAVWTHSDPILSTVILSLAVLIHILWDFFVVRGELLTRSEESEEKRQVSTFRFWKKWWPFSTSHENQKATMTSGKKRFDPFSSGGDDVSARWVKVLGQNNWEQLGRLRGFDAQGLIAAVGSDQAVIDALFKLLGKVDRKNLFFAIQNDPQGFVDLIKQATNSPAFVRRLHKITKEKSFFDQYNINLQNLDLHLFQLMPPNGQSTWTKVKRWFRNVRSTVRDAINNFQFSRAVRRADIAALISEIDQVRDLQQSFLQAFDAGEIAAKRSSKTSSKGQLFELDFRSFSVFTVDRNPLESMRSSQNNLSKIDAQDLKEFLLLLRHFFPKHFMPLYEQGEGDPLSVVDALEGRNIDRGAVRENLALLKEKFGTAVEKLPLNKFLFLVFLRPVELQRLLQRIAIIYGNINQVKTNQQNTRTFIFAVADETARISAILPALNIDAFEWILKANDQAIQKVADNMRLAELGRTDKEELQWLASLTDQEASRVQEICAALDPSFRNAFIDLALTFPTPAARAQLFTLEPAVFAEWQTNNQEDFRALPSICKAFVRAMGAESIRLIIEIIKKRDIAAVTALESLASSELEKSDMKSFRDFLIGAATYSKKVEMAILMSDWLVIKGSAGEDFVERVSEDINRAFAAKQGAELARQVSTVIMEAKRQILQTIVDQDIPEKLLQNKPLMSKIMVLISLRYSIMKLDLDSGDKARMEQMIDEALKRFTKSSGDIEDLTQWILGLTKNKEELDRLKKAGYKTELWTTGVTIRGFASSDMTEDAQREQRTRQTHQIVEIAKNMGLVTSQDLSNIVLENHAEAEEFVNRIILGNRVLALQNISVSEFEQYESNLHDILRDFKRIELIQESKTKEDDVTIVIKKDFLEEGTAGVGVPGCFNPFTGIHREMPVMHGLESNAFFAIAYNSKGEQIANVVLVLTDEGVFAFGDYNRSSLNLDPLWTEAWKQLANLVPSVILGPTSAGQKTSRSLGINGPVNTVKRATLWSDPYFDNVQPDPKGNAVFNISEAVRLTERSIKNAGGLEASKALQLQWQQKRVGQTMKKERVVSGESRRLDAIGKAMAADAQTKPLLFLISKIKNSGLSLNQITPANVRAWITERNDSVSNEIVQKILGFISASSESSVGGIMIWLRSLVLLIFPKVSLRTYDRWVAPNLENGLVIFSQLILMSQGMDVLSAGLWSWGLFAVIHFIEWGLSLSAWAFSTNNRHGRGPPLAENFGFSMLIAGFSLALLSFLPVSTALSLPFLGYVAASTVFHIAVNTLATKDINSQRPIYDSAREKEKGQVSLFRPWENRSPISVSLINQNAKAISGNRRHNPSFTRSVLSRLLPAILLLFSATKVEANSLSDVLTHYTSVEGPGFEIPVLIAILYVFRFIWNKLMLSKQSEGSEDQPEEQNPHSNSGETPEESINPQGIGEREVNQINLIQENFRINDLNRFYPVSENKSFIRPGVADSYVQAVDFEFKTGGYIAGRNKWINENFIREQSVIKKFIQIVEIAQPAVAKPFRYLFEVIAMISTLAIAGSLSLLIPGTASLSWEASRLMILAVVGTNLATGVLFLADYGFTKHGGIRGAWLFLTLGLTRSPLVASVLRVIAITAFTPMLIGLFGSAADVSMYFFATAVNVALNQWIIIWLTQLELDRVALPLTDEEIEHGIKEYELMAKRVGAGLKNPVDFSVLGNQLMDLMLGHDGVAVGQAKSQGRKVGVIPFWRGLRFIRVSRTRDSLMTHELWHVWMFQRGVRKANGNSVAFRYFPSLATAVQLIRAVELGATSIQDVEAVIRQATNKSRSREFETVRSLFGGSNSFTDYTLSSLETNLFGQEENYLLGARMAGVAFVLAQKRAAELEYANNVRVITALAMQFIIECDRFQSIEKGITSLEGMTLKDVTLDNAILSQKQTKVDVGFTRGEREKGQVSLSRPWENRSPISVSLINQKAKAISGNRRLDPSFSFTGKIVAVFRFLGAGGQLFEERKPQANLTTGNQRTDSQLTATNPTRPSSILDPLFRLFQSFSWGRPIYWILTVIGASIWETAVFQNHGFASLTNYFISTGLDSSLSAALGITGIGIIFAFSHTIITWLARVKMHGWRNAFSAESLKGDVKDFGVRTGLSVGFTLPFLFLDPLTASIVTIILHGLYNSGVLTGIFPRWMPIASILNEFAAKPLSEIPPGSQRIEKNGKVLLVSPKALEEMKKLDEFARDRDLVAEIAGYGLTRPFALDDTSSILVDFIAPDNKKIFVIDGLFINQFLTAFSAALGNSKTLSLLLKDDQIELVSDNPEVSFSLQDLGGEKIGWSALYQYIERLTDRKLPTDVDELKELLRAQGQIKLNTDWECVVSGGSVWVTHVYHSRVHSEAKRQDALPNYTMHHHPQLMLSVMGLEGESQSDKEHYYDTLLRFSTGDLIHMKMHEVDWFEIRALGNAQNLSERGQTTSAFYSMSLVDEIASPLAEEISKLMDIKEATPQGLTEAIERIQPILDKLKKANFDHKTILKYKLGQKRFDEIHEQVFYPKNMTSVKDLVLAAIFSSDNPIESLKKVTPKVLGLHFQLKTHSLYQRARLLLERQDILREVHRYFDQHNLWWLSVETDENEIISRTAALEQLISLHEGQFASIFDPLINWLHNFGWGKPVYWLLTVAGASIWETYVFQNHGFVNLTNHFISGRLDSSLSAILGIAGIGIAFAFAHTIVTWLVRVKTHGWRNAFSAAALKADAKDFGVRTGLSIGFTLPFLFLDPITASIVTIIAHSLYNAAVLAGVLPKGAPVADIFDKRERERITPASNAAMRDGAGWLADMGVALLKNDVASLVAAKPLNIGSLGSASIDSEVAVIGQLNDWVGNPAFRDQLIQALRGRVDVKNMTENELNSFVDLLISVVLVKNGVGKLLSSTGVGVHQLFLFHGKSGEGTERSRRSIGIMTTLLQGEKNSSHTFVVDADAQQEIENTINTMKKYGFNIGAAEIKLDGALFKQQKADLRYLESTYGQSSRVILPRNMKPEDAPDHVIAFEDLLAPLERLNLSTLIQSVRAALIAA